MQMLQDIIDDDGIKLDWFFRLSLVSDIVNVSRFMLNGFSTSYDCRLFNSSFHFIFVLLRCVGDIVVNSIVQLSLVT